MQVDFYTFAKRRNSTKQPAGGTSYDCIIKDGSGVVNPTISLKWDGSSSPAAFNYAHIGAFGRYYWINEWRYIDRQWTAALSSDTLASAKTEIGAASKYILRSSNQENKNIADDKYPAKMPMYTEANIAALSEAWATDFSGGAFVLSIVGQGNSFSAAGANYVFVTGNQLQDLLNQVFNANAQEWSITSLGNSIGEALASYGDKLNKSLQNPIQFINSVYWCPVDPVPAGVDTIKLGRMATTVYGTLISNPVKEITFQARTVIDQRLPKWHYLEPFSSYTLYVPPFGAFPLDARLVASKGGVDGSIFIDVTNGQSLLQVKDPDNNAVLFQAGGQVGCRINLSGQSIDYAGQLQSAVGGVGGVVGAALTGNIPGAIVGGLSAVGNVVRGGMPTAVNGGYGGGLAALRGFRGIVRSFMYPADTDSVEQGSPIMEVHTISDYPGFLMLAEGDIQAALTPGELDQIAGFLTGGFFYE